MGVPLERAVSTLRFSVGHETTAADIDYVLATLPAIVERSRAKRVAGSAADGRGLNHALSEASPDIMPSMDETELIAAYVGVLRHELELPRGADALLELEVRLVPPDPASGRPRAHPASPASRRR